MKHYTVTLLKDLPDIKAGFSFMISEEELKDYHHKNLSVALNYPNPELFTRNAEKVLDYKEYTDWVKIEYNFSKAVKVICPKCGKLGMFSFKDDELECDNEYNSFAASYFENGGVECVDCGYKAYVYRHFVRSVPYKDYYRKKG